MQFEKVPQEVFKLEDIKTLVESIKVEFKENFCVVFNFELHAQRLLNSIIELNFELPKAVTEEEFGIFILTQIKNKLQYKFNSQVMFTEKQGFTKGKVFKLRLIYQKDSSFLIEIKEYKRDLDKEWKVKILDKEEFHIESTNPIWQHKFLPRPDFSYFFEQGFDELIWCDENDNICEGSFSAIIFEEENGIKSPKANTLPSTTLKKMDLENIYLEYSEIKRDNFDQKNFTLVNSLVKKDVSLQGA
jgi:branched-subunit amino acid aminotransferase/4-amino-4-deoxychorismate lyase